MKVEWETLSREPLHFVLCMEFGCELIAGDKGGGKDSRDMVNK